MSEYIARISYGKDSLKMLDVIHSRGLPLDRITTTDVWATDTISANLPPMEEFKARMDERIWQMYRIEVEHLCARNKDGSKKTYEQMFYHIPVRRSQIGNVEREREREKVPGRQSGGLSGARASMVSDGTEKTGRFLPPRWRVQGEITGFPPNTGYNWCQKLKLPADIHQGIPSGNGSHILSEAQIKGFRPRYPHGAESSKSTRSQPLFRRPRHEGQEKKYRGIPWNRG